MYISLCIHTIEQTLRTQSYHWLIDIKNKYTGVKYKYTDDKYIGINILIFDRLSACIWSAPLYIYIYMLCIYISNM